MRTQSDEHGRMTHIALLDAQGQPARRDGELLPWERIAYDEFGNRAMIEKVDPQGDPLPTDEGWWKRVREHGPRGRLAREVFHSAPNAAMAYARVVHELSYDAAEGTTTTREHLEDEAGNRVPFPGDGHDQVTQTTDKQDRLIRQRRSGYDESELGYAATVETTQWAGDRPTAVTMHFENASGEAVRTHGGYTTQTQQVRDGGRVWITYSGFDEAEYGHASVVLMVDAQGDLQGFRHLDAAGEVVGPIEVFVARVLEGGQAQRVGLQAGDVLAAVGGEPVQSALLFEPAVGEGGATLDARRDGRTLSYHVQPGPLGLVARDRVVKVKR
jgi:hypothetical protein